LLGYLGADFDLRELPATQALYQQPEQWMQMKGDPAIRAGLFHQERVNSPLDEHIDEVLALIDELITVHGVFHAKLHFSSSRATLWVVDDPFRYRLHGIADLSDPNLCLAYPRLPYPADASIPAEKVRDVLNCFKELRFMDETLYLRSGTINIFNGMVGLTFSCDGSHYMPWDEFLDKNVGFWVGASGLFQLHLVGQLVPDQAVGHGDEHQPGARRLGDHGLGDVHHVEQHLGVGGEGGLVFRQERINVGHLVQGTRHQLERVAFGQHHGGLHGHQGGLAAALGIGHLAVHQHQVAPIGDDAGLACGFLEIDVVELLLLFVGVEQHDDFLEGSG
jgi:hypothetical protein